MASAPGRDERRSGRRWLDAIDAKPWTEPGGVAALGVFAALLFYAITRTATGRFYSKLGIRVEDLGLGYPGLIELHLGLAIVSLIVSTVMLLGALLLALLAAWAIDSRDSSEEQGWRRHLRTDRARALAVTIPVGVLTLLNAVAGDWFAVTVDLVFAAAIGVFVWARRALIVGLLALGVVGFVYAQLLYASASDAADGVERGEAPGTDLFGVPLVPWRASPAVLRWAGGDKPEIERCVLVLNSDERSTIIYAPDSDGHRVRLTVKSEQASFEVLPDLARCPWPEPKAPEPAAYKGPV